MGSQALASPEFRIAFPMAQDPASDDWLRAQTERVLRRLLDTLGREKLRAVILAGSLARGEGGVMFSRGGTTAVADLDLYAVARSEGDRAALREARHRFLRESADGAFRADVGIATAADLAALPDTIANVSLSREGHVVWGEEAAAQLVRRADPAGIPREDALNLVLNRAAEELAALRAAEREPASEQAAFALFYRGIKTTADTGLAFLIARGACDPTYRGRRERVERMIATDSTLTLTHRVPADFARDVGLACAWKLSPDPAVLDGHLPGTAQYPAAAREALGRRIDAVGAFCRWYTGDGSASARSVSNRSGGTGDATGPGDSTGSLAALDALERSEPLPRAVRAWARSARRSSASSRELAGRIAAGRLRPTPRLSVQLAALWLYVTWIEPSHAALARAARLLPRDVVPAAASREALADAAVRAWGREIMGWRLA